MSTIRGIVIPANDELSVQVVEFEQGDINAYQRYVGGMFQCLDIDSPPASIFCNEEAKLIGLELNRRATMLWWTHYPPSRHADIINGDVVIVGQPDDEGETQGVPDELLSLLTQTTEWRYEVSVINESGWHRNGRTFNNVWAAYNDGLALLDRWVLAQQVRVVPA
ncbi:DUF3846 domain-containing protein [Rhodococcus hoagii]|nr:DUF3846 domain-containing protein [Prescottella equi]